MAEERVEAALKAFEMILPIREVILKRKMGAVFERF